MMNQYLCRTYLAEEAASHLTNFPAVNRRMGYSTNFTNNIENPNSHHMTDRKSLLMDEGSSTYQDWLSKSTVLEDIYRHYNEPKDRAEVIEDEPDEEVKDMEDTPHKGSDREEVYYPAAAEYPSSYYTDAGLGSYYKKPADSVKGGYTVPLPYYHDSDATYHTPTPPKYHGHHDEDEAREKDLTDLFEVALTALAYLSFGVFAIHVVTSISSVMNSATETPPSMIIPMSLRPTPMGTGTGGMTGTGGRGRNGFSYNITGSEETTTATETDSDAEEGTTTTEEDMTETGNDSSPTEGEEDGDASDEDMNSTEDEMNVGVDVNDSGTADDDGVTVDDEMENGDGEAEDDAAEEDTNDAVDDSLNFRFKRDMPSIVNPNMQVINELARRILIGMESMVIAEYDSGECLRKCICETNKWSRTLDDKNKMMVPIFNLGMSWFSGIFIKNISPAVSRLDSLKASIFGLGNANCGLLFKKCDLGEHIRRRRRKKK